MNREKKQMAVLGVLALMVVCVGAFQLVGGGSPAPAPAAKKEAKKSAAEPTQAEVTAKAIVNPTEATPLARRDPFAPSEFAVVASDTRTPEQIKKEQEQAGQKGEATPLKGGGLKPVNNTHWNPPGGFTPGGEVGPLEPAAPKFSYSLIGFVRGRYPAAVFVDTNGNQRLVEAGQAIDSSATLIAVYGDKVKVKFNQETLFLTVGGNPNAK